jgi:hypothetical protein
VPNRTRPQRVRAATTVRSRRRNMKLSLHLIREWAVAVPGHAEGTLSKRNDQHLPERTLRLEGVKRSLHTGGLRLESKITSDVQPNEGDAFDIKLRMK